MTEQMEKLYAKRDDLLKSFNPEEPDAGIVNELKQIVAQINTLSEFEDVAKSKEADEPVKTNKQKDVGFKMIVDVCRGKISDQLIQGGTQGENYLIPEDVNLFINERKREWKQAKELCTVMTAPAVTGKFNFDVDPTTGLVSFDDGDTIDSSVNPTFVQKTYTIGYYGAIIPVSNLLQGNERAQLGQYLRNWFAKRAVISENTSVFTAMKAGYNSGTPKALADWKALKKSINKDLDPAITGGDDFVIVTNQSGFDVLDGALDNTGRPVLQPDPTNPTQYRFMGHPVVVFSDTQLGNNTTGSPNKAPIIYGNLKSAFWYFENPNYEFATDGGMGTGFVKNQTYLRVIEGYAVMAANTTDYIYGELPLA